MDEPSATDPTPDHLDEARPETQRDQSRSRSSRRRSSPPPVDSPAAGGGGKSIAEKVEFLFQTIRPGPGPAKFTYQQVQDRARDLGYRLSDSTVQNMRNGSMRNPTRDSMTAVAKAFGVSPAYFMDEEAAEQIDQQLQLLALLQNPAVRAIATRMPDLSEDNQVLLVSIIEQMRKISGHTDEDGAAGPGGRRT